MTNLEIGNRIKCARDIQNITLDEIALKVGVAKSTVQRYEAGKIETPKLPVLESIAKALKVNPSWLIGKSEDMTLKKEEAPRILNYFNALNDIGKREATKRVEELTYIAKYTSADNKQPELMAAHNDAIQEDGEIEKIKKDLSILRRPD